MRPTPDTGAFQFPGPGESLYYRWYYRNVVPNTYNLDTGSHPIEDGNTGSNTNWMFDTTVNTDGTWFTELNTSFNGTPWPDNRFGIATGAYPATASGLAKGQTYRFEVQIKRLSSDSMRLEHRHGMPPDDDEPNLPREEESEQLAEVARKIHQPLPT